MTRKLMILGVAALGVALGIQVYIYVNDGCAITCTPYPECLGIQPDTSRTVDFAHSYELQCFQHCRTREFPIDIDPPVPIAVVKFYIPVAELGDGDCGSAAFYHDDEALADVPAGGGYTEWMPGTGDHKVNKLKLFCGDCQNGTLIKVQTNKYSWKHGSLDRYQEDIIR